MTQGIDFTKLKAVSATHEFLRKTYSDNKKPCGKEFHPPPPTPHPPKLSS